MNIPILSPLISTRQNDHLIKIFTMKEVEETLWPMQDDKAPSPDGYLFFFFKQFYLIKFDIFSGYPLFH